MPLSSNIEQARSVAPELYHKFKTTGIHGRVDMPEDLPPKGVEVGSLEHILFLTFTVAIDYQRDAHALWESARKTYEDPRTRYLFDPRSLHETPFPNIFQDMQIHNLSKKPRKDAWIWSTNGITFYKKWNGDPRMFFADCGYDGPVILSHLKGDHHSANGRNVWDYPYLRGNKIGPLWLRMLRDNAGITSFKNLDQVPIPVDVHVARASLCLGIVHGKFEGSLEEVFGAIRKAWKDGVQGVNAGNLPMIALDIDEPLWHLSKFGCTMRDSSTGMCPIKNSCEFSSFCIPGRISIQNQKIILDTTPQ